MNLHFSDTGGNGPVLILLHGRCCRGAMLAPLVEMLRDEFRVIAPDLPGHGATPLGNFQPSFPGYTQCLVDFVANFENPVLAGHSMGGALALMTAAATSVRAVVNLDGSLPPSAKTDAGRAALQEILSHEDWRDRFATVFQSAFFLPHERDARSLHIIATMCAAPEAVLRGYPEQARSIDPEKILSRIKCPVIYVSPDEPRFDAEAARRLLPHATFARIAGAGHFLPVYESEKVAGIIREFVESLPAS